MTTNLFNGPAYKPERDNTRLTEQMKRVHGCMSDGQWRTLSDIKQQTGDPEASISAQLRHLRKARFGAHTVKRRYKGNGLHEYQLVLNRNAVNQ